MPPRISRSSLPNARPKNSGEKSTGKGGPAHRNSQKSKRRALNAFAIASHEAPDRIKVRQHRLGESDLSNHRKRDRDEDEDDVDDDEEPNDARRRKQKKVEKDRLDEMDVSEGSDSEGNTWMMGHVDEDDDSDIDSDEAFGESDEERFEGWTFRGSSTTQNGKGKAKKKAKKVESDEDEGREIDLDEGDSEDAEEEEDEDDLGEDAIDLATALDQWEESDEEDEKPKSSNKDGFGSDDEPSEEDDLAGDGASELSMSDEEDDEDEEENDPSQVARLKNLISSLPQDEEPTVRVPRTSDALEFSTPSEFGVQRKVDLTAWQPKTSDPDRKKALKLLRDDIKSSNRPGIARKLEAPLPKRQQDKLDRAAANKQANDTLSRWVDTVKQNRRAEHLEFPLRRENAQEPQGTSMLLPTTTTAPANDLESTIQSILIQSGLSNGQDDDEQIQKWEELQTNKLPLEEVEARRAELRKQRELMFREEVRAKRIKKIKSKSYRRVHRKERERMEQKEREALKADGIDVSEDEREYNDRRRAEERMGAKHRESRWAKGMKDSGRTVWDEDARAGVTEMARRNEELRRRQEGKTVRDPDEEGSDLSSEEEQDDDQDDNQVLQQQLGRLKYNPFSMADQSKLGGMAFMQKAEAARRAQNDEDIERMRRDLAGEESQSEDQDENSARSGRKKFGPVGKTARPAIQFHNEFEEKEEQDEDAVDAGSDVEATPDKPKATRSRGRRGFSGKAYRTEDEHSVKSANTSSNPYLDAPPTKEKKVEKTKKMAIIATNEPEAFWKAQDDVAALQPKATSKSKSKSKSKKVGEDPDFPEATISAPDADGFQTISYDHDDDNGNDDDIENEGIDLDVVLHNQSLTSKAFAGDDIEAEFAAEKAAIVSDEADKVVDNTLPGWGSWTGEGLSKKTQRRNRSKHLLTTIPGVVAPDKRKDAKLEKVIINQKKVKKNDKYLASTLPFPFESREQYERSLRLPKGGEWNTKTVFQENTKPRVIIKQGVIAPLRKPMA